MDAAAHEILIAGIGAIAQVHLQVLEQIPEASVVAGIDTAPHPDLQFRGRAVPVYPTAAQASGRHSPGIVVIATPTPAHAAVCGEIAAAFPAARILIEKPAAGTLADARHVLADIGGHQSVDVAYHMSFSPEVQWGLQVTQARAADLGSPCAIEASFADPYQDQPEAVRATYGSSWIDSGINCLSVLNRFTDVTARRSLRRIGEVAWSAFEARVSCRTGGSDLEALILTSWHVTDPARSSRIRYESGAELVMDHHAVTGYLTQDRQIRDLFGSDRSVSRQERHYRALYQWWLVEGSQIASPETHLRLHEILLQPADAPASADG